MVNVGKYTSPMNAMRLINLYSYHLRIATGLMIQTVTEVAATGRIAYDTLFQPVQHRHISTIRPCGLYLDWPNRGNLQEITFQKWVTKLLVIICYSFLNARSTLFFFLPFLTLGDAAMPCQILHFLRCQGSGTEV